MNQISAKIVADSINKIGDRITTMEVVFPRFILAEFNTHRLFSRNSASSRAIPFKKMVEMVKNNPFIPIAWQKDHSGMQGTQYFEGWRHKVLTLAWKAGAKTAVFSATKLHKLGLTKQLCNRLLEPFMYHKVLVTFTESENFFNLRCPQYQDLENINIYFKSKKDLINKYPMEEFVENFTDLDWLKINKGQGEIHIMDLAEKMLDAMNDSTPKELKAGEWHIPYGENIDVNGLDDIEIPLEQIQDFKCKIAIARSARLSYQTLGDDPKIDYLADLKLFDILRKSGHFSPFEHVARAMHEMDYDRFLKQTPDNMLTLKSQGWCGNFKGFIQYRYLLES